ncbi:PAS domain-containing protein [Vibrio parahaemolyticus]|uniref:hypothetical protein n=1 Tax=Vibrio parahaemolyticus TaxID=670 RepID=UPI0004079716|nr:hypothetical protein [Vibrio parahaemolyticus]
MQFTLEHAQDVLSGMPDPTFILSEDGIYIDVFGGTDKKAYHDGSNLIGKTLHSVLEKEQADWFIEQINRSLNQDSIVTIEYKMCADSIQGIDANSGPKGDLYYEGKICPLTINYQGRRVVLILTRNISNRHRVETLLRHQSQIDALTNIYNRRVFSKSSQKKSLNPKLLTTNLLYYCLIWIFLKLSMINVATMREIMS